MLPYFSEKFGNPSSTTHRIGIAAKEAVEIARKQVAKAIGAQPHEIIFTSGATESNNLAIKGIARAYQKKTKKNHIITCITEHKSVLESCRDLEKEGFEVTYLSVEKNGLINIEKLTRAITDKTILVSIMAANNEIGVLQPILQIGSICSKRGIIFHTDASQGIGRIPLSVSKIDALSISGHKIYGPKGVGALYIKDGIDVEPIFSGGGQERKLRSGTLPVPLCVGLGRAIEIAVQELPSESKRIKKLRDMMYGKITKSLKGVYLNGDVKHRLPCNLHLSFSQIDLQDLVKELEGFSVSVSSACTEHSHVMRAIDPEQKIPPASIRICLGRFTSKEDVIRFADKIISVVQILRKNKPNAGKRACNVDSKSRKFIESK